MTKSLDKKAIKNTIRDTFEVFGFSAEEAIQYSLESNSLKTYLSKQLDYAYKILIRQIKDRIKLKSVQTKYLQQAENLYNSLRKK